MKSPNAGDDSLAGTMFGVGVILTFINPIAGIAAIFSSLFLSDYLLEKKKNEIKSTIQKETAAVIEELSKTFCAELRSCIDKLTGWSENILDSYKERYSSLYSHAERNYEQNKANNAQERELRTRALEELDSLSKSITEWRSEEWTNSMKRGRPTNPLANAFQNLFRLMSERSCAGVLGAGLVSSSG